MVDKTVLWNELMQEVEDQEKQANRKPPYNEPSEDAKY
jgi:hypothetical protein